MNGWTVAGVLFGWVTASMLCALAVGKTIQLRDLQRPPARPVVDLNASRA